MKRMVITCLTAGIFLTFVGCSGAKKEQEKIGKSENPEVQKQKQDGTEGEKRNKPGNQAIGGEQKEDGKSQNSGFDENRFKEILKRRGITADSEQGKQMKKMMQQGGFREGGMNRGGSTSSSGPVVKVEEVKNQTLKAFITLNGKVEPERSVKIYARLSAFVKEIKREEDDYIKKGTVIALLDDTEIKISYNQAKNQLEQAEFALKLEEEKFNRSTELMKSSLLSTQDFDAIKASNNNAKIEFKNNQENFKNLQLQLAYTKVTSPIEGYITERIIDVGSKVNGNEHIYTVEDFSPLLIKLFVPVSDAINIKRDMKVEIRSELYQSRVFIGSVKLINPRIDAESGTIKVTIEAYEKEKLLKPGMFIEAKILISEDSDKLAVPSKSIVHIKGKSYVYKFQMGKVKLTAVETGITQEDLVEITQGLKLGDKIVTVGVEDLKDDIQVKVSR